MGEFWDNLYSNEFDLIDHVRDFLGPKFETPLYFLSRYLGPSNMIAYALPIVGAYDSYLLSKIMVVLSILNLFTGLLKILINEDRPYWWGVRNGREFKQSHITCESTSGCPSGHSSGISVFCYMLTSYYLPDMEQTSVILCISPIILLMIISRMYFYCHFFHQCLLGAILGIAGCLYYNQDYVEDYILNMTPMESLTVYLTIALVSIIEYLAMIKFGRDPDWSFTEAQTACEDSSWVHLDQSPLYNLVKDLGAIAGIALSAPIYEKVESDLDKKRSVPLAIFIGALNIFMNSKIPDASEKGALYSFGFIKLMVYTYSLMNVIPRFSMLEKPCPCSGRN